MKLQIQSELFSREAEVAFDATFARAVRAHLDAFSWVELVPGWATGAERLFEQLAHGVPWEQHTRRLFDQDFLEPRLTAEYRRLEDAPHEALRQAAAVLSAHYGPVYDSVWLNLYRDGNDSTGWHRDRFSCRRATCIVPVLTLGTARRFLVKPRKGGRSVVFTPRPGDLVVMGGRCQEDWVHGVPKAPGSAGARISVNFQSAEQARKD